MPEAGKGKLVVSIQPLGLERPGFGVVHLMEIEKRNRAEVMITAKTA
jgi:hypothetical protein